jgi:serine/threonine protein kinase/Tfp pilus assembly protein PilF
MAISVATVVATCSVCSEALNAKGDCLVCLLRTALDEPVVEDASSASLVFGDFEIVRREDGSLWELGHGGMGVTYLACDKVLRRKVALKVIDTLTVSPCRNSQTARERFLREARAAGALRHPNVAAVFQFGAAPDGSRCFYAMELIEGETLEARVRRDGPLNPKLVVEIATQIAQALIAAAAQGLIHRDLKPGNIMLKQGNAGATELEVKIIDFGLAKAIADVGGEMDITHGEFVGTPNFASPEQFESGPVDVRSDIYSLGATLWFALTGKTPFAGRNIEEIRRAHKSESLPIEQLKAARAPSRLRSLLKSMLAFEPAARPGVKDLPTQLRRCSAQLSGAPRVGVALTAAVILLLGMTAFFIFHSLRTHPAATGSASNPAPPEKSIAVLPLENLSADPDNAYFAEGIQEEILTQLAKIADLKVISRSSTQRYQSKPGNLAEIAKQLGVATILEGSVQKAADQVRVNVQLVNAQTDFHLWAETYDRKLTDIFSVESEIAKGIAESLQAKLTGHEEQALAVRPTNNVEAYDAYLRGLSFEARSSYSIDLLEKATGLYERAVELDPNFALGWARLSRADALLYFTGADPTAARRDAAKSALENAQKLQPNSPETLLALGYYQYWVLRDYGLAKTTFKRIQKLLPGSSDVLNGLGAVSRREGHWDQSVAYSEQALALDPRNVDLLNETALTYVMLRQFRAALKLYDRGLDIVPNDPDLMASKAGIYQAEGNLEQAAKFLSEINGQTPYGKAFGTKFTQLRLERNLDEAIRLLQARQAQFHFASEIEWVINQVTLAIVQRLAGDTAGAKTNAEQARNTLGPLCKNQPDNYLFAGMLSLANAALGEKDSALKEAERAITLLPSAKDRMYGPGFEENLALIQTMFGANSQTISTLTQLLQTPYYSWFYSQTPVTPALLRLDPLWDPLRADPAFQKLVASLAPKSK